MIELTEIDEMSSINQTVEYDDEKVSIAWRNLRYEAYPFGIRRIGKGKTILRRLNGHLLFNTLNGFLGPSGAGKTTLLNCLNGTLRSGLSNDSELYLNRYYSNIGYKPIIRFIEQHVHETIIGIMTVGEILYYAFRFKNSISMRQKQYSINEHIDKIFSELILDKAILKRRFDQCSGGEQKRIAIAQELMSLKMPSFLFLDEPTTGLDSHAALLMVRCLRNLIDNLSKEYRFTILASIHAPNSDIINLFDKIYILARNGFCIYSGSPKLLRNNMIDEHLEFDDNNFRTPIEEFMRIACKDIDDNNVRKLATKCFTTENEILRPLIDRMQFLDNGLSIRYKSFNFQDFLFQLIRMFQLIFIKQIKNRIFTIMVFIILFYFHASLLDPRMVEPDTCTLFDDPNQNLLNLTCQDRVHSRFMVDMYFHYQGFAIAFFGFLLIGLSSIVYSELMKIIDNEHRNGWCNINVFYWSITLIRLLELIILTLLTTLLVYFLANHNYVDNGHFNWNRFGHFAFFFFLFAFHIQSIGHFISCVISQPIPAPITASSVLYFIINGYDGYLFPDKYFYLSFNRLLSKLLAGNVITHGLLYSFYYLDRCDPNTQISTVFLDNDIDPERIFINIIPFLIISILLRLWTSICFIVKFKSITLFDHLFKRSDEYQSKLIDFETDTNTDTDTDTKQSCPLDMNNNTHQRIKTEKEIEFQKFCQDKIIIGWRSLSLFAKDSLYKMQSTKNIQPDSSELILRNLNGQFRFGTINALMGTSGAGKTSLLRVLNGQNKTRLSLESQFYLSKYTPIQTSFITQEISGHLMPGLTAKQSLIFASRLKNLNDSNVDHEKIATTLLNELNILYTADTLVTKCSGGERKRLALALELTSRRMPNFICIDEPTSGLDSNSAEILISCLRSMSHRHKITLVIAIHQPNIDILKMFDHVYLLARGGVCIYSGTPDNINEFVRQVSSVVDDHDAFPLEELIRYSCRNHQDEQIKRLVQATDETILNDDQEGKKLFIDCQSVSNGFPINRTRFSLNSINILFQRQYYCYGNYLWPLILFFYASSLLLSLNYRLLLNPKIAERKGCVSFDEDFLHTCNYSRGMKMDLILSYRYSYFIYSTSMFLPIGISALLYYLESKNMINEYQNGWYTTGVIYLVRWSTHAVIILPIIIIHHYITDIFDSVRPGIFYPLLFVYLLTAIAAQGLGYICGILFGSNLTYLCISLPSLFLISIIVILSEYAKSIPFFYPFIKFNPIRYLNEASLVLQYGFGRCGPREISLILYKLDINHDDYFYECILRTIINLIIYHSIAFSILYYQRNNFNNRERMEKLQQSHQNQRQSLNIMIPGLTCDHQFTIKQFRN
ncbi:uncharacterized protein LOC113798562 isoform X1 [Dermatophagoides pteronyssinus]|uniref:uncharacterized protein LOC113798562 isoform X1 n=1 Tax=Dermatophagoides pteronyssinus TaxID=6956 RepID=UPI003F67F236